MKTIVIKISGSLFYWERVEDGLPPIASVVRKAVSKGGSKLVVVAGGGETARRYIKTGRKLGGGEGLLDDMGLRAARLNAGLLISSLGDLAYPIVPEDLGHVIEAVETTKVVVTGGLHPGHSTNAVAALIGERLRADLLVNTTDVDGVYTSDPDKDKSAKLLPKVTTQQLRDMFGSSRMLAGTYELLDLVAINVIERAGLRTRIIKCAPKEIEEALQGKAVGTEIVREA
ncbi:MAG: UMP kinase [Nitrososphaerota archaeon]|nr:UMP kinase [Nitrososphaerota archaeon]